MGKRCPADRLHTDRRQTDDLRFLWVCGALRCVDGTFISEMVMAVTDHGRQGEAVQRRYHTSHLHCVRGGKKTSYCHLIADYVATGRQVWAHLGHGRTGRL